MSQINRYRCIGTRLSGIFWYLVFGSDPKKLCKVSAVSIGVSVTRYRSYFGIYCTVLDIKKSKILVQIEVPVPEYRYRYRVPEKSVFWYRYLYRYRHFFWYRDIPRSDIIIEKIFQELNFIIKKYKQYIYVYIHISRGFV